MLKRKAGGQERTLHTPPGSAPASAWWWTEEEAVGTVNTMHTHATSSITHAPPTSQMKQKQPVSSTIDPCKQSNLFNIAHFSQAILPHMNELTAAETTVDPRPRPFTGLNQDYDEEVGGFSPQMKPFVPFLSW